MDIFPASVDIGRNICSDRMTTSLYLARSRYVLSLSRTKSECSLLNAMVNYKNKQQPNIHVN